MGYTAQNYYSYPISGTGSANLTVADRTSYMLFYVPASTTFDRIATRTGATFSGTANVRLGIYNNSNFAPSTVLLDAGQVSCTASSTIYEITINQTLSEGWYWLAWNAQDVATTNNFIIGSSIAGFTMSMVNANIQYAANYNETGVTGAFATAGSLAFGTNPAIVALRKS